MRRHGTLLVASTGGHLEELTRLRGRFDPPLEDVEWVTFAGPQSDTLLAGEVVHHLRYVEPRGYRSMLANVWPTLQLFRRRRYARVVSTGSGVAIPVLAVARAFGAESHYVESAARSQEPSFTGKVVGRLPGVHRYTQYPDWDDARWSYRGSLFDGYAATEAAAPDQASKVVVTLGTMRTYEFRRAVERLANVLPEVTAAGADVLWQVGATDVSGLGIDGRDTVTSSELGTAIREADLVIAHAGVGSALTALEVGRRPLLLPRRRAHGEHVDDHQEMIGAELDRRGLAVCCEADAVSAADLRAAMAGSVAMLGSPPAFRLG